jgi:hypothetical protein
MKLLQSSFLIFVLAMPAFSQIASVKNESCHKRALEIVNTLGKDNPLREAVERGSSGDCVRFDWMDEMKRFGIKHASFLVEYNWKDGSVRFKIKSKSYLTTYYTDFEVYSIKDKVLLKQIKESGLGKSLEDVVLKDVWTSGFEKREKGTVSKDVFQVDLFDDESLPLSYMILC